MKHDNDVKADIVISTIQKLFAVLTGQQLSEDSEDAEDERTTQEEEKEGKDIYCHSSRQRNNWFFSL